MDISNKKNPGISRQPEERQGRKLTPITKEIGKGIIILFILIAAFKFISWNFFKLEQVADTTKEFLSASPAVNLTVQKGKTTLFRRGFPFDRKGICYIVNRFDITPHVTGEPIRLTVNDRPLAPLRVFRFTRFNILSSPDYCFVFTTPRCEIEDLVRLRDIAPFIPGALSKLAVDSRMEETEKNPALHRPHWPENTGKILKYHSGRFSMALPPGLKKEETCEVVFQYQITGRVWPVVLLTAGSHSKREIIYHRLLDITPGHPGKVSFLVPAPTGTAPAVFHIAARYPWTRPPYTGTVHIKNLALYRYTPDQKPFRTSLAYLDIAAELKNEFIELL